MSALSIAFVASKCLPFHGPSLEEGPLGGTETAVIRLAEALSERGHSVSVYTSHDSPQSLPSKPIYKPIQQLHTAGSHDVLVAVRDWLPLCVPLPARRRCFWTGDSYDQPQTFGIGDRRVAARIDALLAVSAWHAATLSSQSGFPIEKTWVLPNGVHLPHFEKAESKVRKRMIYSSTPYRGLALCPEIFSQILKLHPDAELHIFSGYQVYGGGDGFDMAEFEDTKKKLANLPNVYFHGNVAQAQLAQEYLRSSILFYPNTFAETSCITAMEAQAAGCAVVTSDLGALKETVGESGFLVAGKPGSPEYIQEFVTATDRLLRDDNLLNRISVHARAKVLAEMGWNHRAAHLENLLVKGLQAKQV